MLVTGGKKLNQKGLTLIELIIAMTVLSVITLGLLTMMASTISVISDTGKKTENTLISQEFIELNLGKEVTTVSSSETFIFGSTSLNVVGEEVTNGEITIFNPQ